jgi:hypothetical protein
MTRQLKSRVALTAGIFIGLTSQSFALDEAAFAQRLMDTFEKNGSPMEIGSVSISGDQIVINDVMFISPEMSVPVGAVIFDKVRETDDGDYTAERASVEDISTTFPDGSFSLKDMEIINLRVPAAGDQTDDFGSIILYDEFRTGAGKFVMDSKDVFQFANTDTKLNIDEANTSINYSASLNGMIMDLSALPNPKATQMMAAMGYQYLTGDVQMKGDWEGKTGRMNNPEFALTLNDVGRLNIGFDLSGYSLGFLEQLAEAQKGALETKDPKAQQASGMAMLGMMQQLSVNSMSIRFDDASLTSRALDFVGQQQGGISGEQMAQAVKGLLPFALARIGIPELQQQITDAVSIYLDNPQSLEIKAQPSEAVSFGQIMGSAMADPRSLHKLLGVTVTANQ